MSKHSALFAIVFLGSAAFAAPAAGGLQVGQAAVDITPPKDMPFHVPQRPPFPVVPAEGVHDPLFAKAIVFESGGVKAAIVACDVTSIPLDYIIEARAFVAKNSGVPAENVMITATHTHTGPNIRPRNFQNATPAQKQIAAAYLREFPRMIGRSVQEAETNLRPARAHGAIAEVHGVAFNRRFLMKEGIVVANPGKGDDRQLVNIVRPAGPIDPAIPVIYFDTPEGAPVATMLNFALHLDTTGGFQYSADFPHVIAGILGRVKAGSMLTHFTYGAAGNINHYFLLNPSRPHRTKGYDEASRIGSLVAAEVVRSYQRMQPLAGAPVKVSREVLKLFVHEARADDIAARSQRAATFQDGDTLCTREDGRYAFEAEVMVVTVGDELAFVGVPGELFVELGLAIKHGSPYAFTHVNSLANGSIGYVPNRKAHSEGAYGASPLTTRCSPGSGEALADSAIRQLIALRAIQPNNRQ
jgi:hypothetical protein